MSTPRSSSIARSAGTRSDCTSTSQHSRRQFLATSRRTRDTSTSVATSLGSSCVLARLPCGLSSPLLSSPLSFFLSDFRSSSEGFLSLSLSLSLSLGRSRSDSRPSLSLFLSRSLSLSLSLSLPLSLSLSLLSLSRLGLGLRSRSPRSVSRRLSVAVLPSRSQSLSRSLASSRSRSSRESLRESRLPRPRS